MALGKYTDPTILQKYADPELKEVLRKKVAKYSSPLPPNNKSIYDITMGTTPYGIEKADDKSFLSSAIDVLGSPGGVITNQIANWADPNLDWKDIPGLESAKQFYEGASDAVKESLLNIPFAPLKGLERIGEESKRTSDITTNLFGEQEAAGTPYTLRSLYAGKKGALDLRDVGEFLGDVALDPLTYATLGGGSAVKAGIQAASKQAAEELTQAGVKNAGKMKDVFTEAPELIKKAKIQQGVSEQDAVKAAKAASQNITNAAKTARNKAQNAIVSLDIPFTNITKQFGNVGKVPLVGKFLERTPRTVDNLGAEAVAKSFMDMRLNPMQQAEILAKYGIQVGDRPIAEAAKELSVDAYTDLQNKLKGIMESPETKIQSNIPLVDRLTSLLSRNDSRLFSEALQQLPKDATQEQVSALLDSIATLKKQEPIPVKAPKKTAPAPVVQAPAKPVLSEFANNILTATGNEKFAQMLDDLKGKIQPGAKVDELVAQLSTPAPVKETAVVAPKKGFMQKTIDEKGFMDMTEAQAKKFTAQHPEYTSKLALDKAGEPVYRVTKSAEKVVQEAVAPKPSAKDKLSLDILNAVMSGNADDLMNLVKTTNGAVSKQTLSAVDNLLEKAGKGEPKLTEDMPKTISDDINKAIETDTPVTGRQINDAFEQDAVAVAKRNKKVDEAVQRVKNKFGKASTPIFSRDAQPAFDGFEWVEDGLGRSRLVNFLLEKSPLRMFNARTLKSDDPFVNWLSNKIVDADTKRYSNAKKMEGELGQIQKVTNRMTAASVRAVQYVIENAFPNGMTKEQYLEKVGANPADVEELATKITTFLDQLGLGDQKAKVLDQMRDAYFPHMIKVTDDMVEGVLKRYGNDQALQNLFGKPEKFIGGSLATRSAKMTSAQRREGFQSFAAIDDYLSKLQDDILKETDPEKIVALNNKYKEISGLFERDTLQALASRAFQSVKSRAMRELYDQFVLDGVIRKVKPKDAPQNFVAVTKADAELLGLAKSLGMDEAAKTEKIYMHKDILQGLKQLDRFFTDKELSDTLKKMNDVVNVWKYTTTVLVPRHYINNFIGNIFNNQMVGVDLQSYKQSGNLLSKFWKKPEELTPKENEMIQMAFDNGVIGQGFTADFLRDNPFAAPQNAAQKITKELDKIKYVRFVRGIGEKTDDFTRLALFMDTLRKTGSTEIAASTVRKYLFNYHELTNADKFVRAVLAPFWSWMKNNIPLQLTQIMQNPRYFVGAQNLRDATFDDSDYPQYVREGYAQYDIPFIGKKVLPLMLPMQDINLPFEPSRTVSTSVAPWVKAPFELTANKNLYTGAPIDVEAFKNRSNDISAESYYKYIANNLGIVGQTFYNIFPTGEDERPPITEFLTKPIFGKPYEEKK